MKGLATFDLVCINDRYFPLLTNQIVVNEDGKEEDVYKFLARAHLEEQEDTARKIGEDKQEFAFMEKYGKFVQLILAVTPAILAIIAVIISVKTNSNVAKELAGFTLELGGIKGALNSVATNLGALVGKGGSLIPPPG